MTGRGAMALKWQLPDAILRWREGLSVWDVIGCGINCWNEWLRVSFWVHWRAGCVKHCELLWRGMAFSMFWLVSCVLWLFITIFSDVHLHTLSSVSLLSALSCSLRWPAVVYIAQWPINLGPYWKIQRWDSEPMRHLSDPCQSCRATTLQSLDCWGMWE